MCSCPAVGSHIGSGGKAKSASRGSAPRGRDPAADEGIDWGEERAFKHCALMGPGPTSRDSTARDSAGSLAHSHYDRFSLPIVESCACSRVLCMPLRLSRVLGTPLSVYHNRSGVRTDSLCFYILPPGARPIRLYFLSGRLAYASLFCLRARSLCRLGRVARLRRGQGCSSHVERLSLLSLVLVLSLVLLLVVVTLT